MAISAASTPTNPTGSKALGSIAPWGAEASFDYCVRGDRLELASEGVYAAYERVYALATAPGGCEWNEYDSAAGCQLVTQAPHCTGTPTPCDAYASDTCADIEGCSVEIDGRCTGPTELDCADFADCPEVCTDIGDGCMGTTACSAFTYKFDCTGALDEAADPLCTWQDRYCTGEPPACDQLPFETCAAVPGCKLEQ